MSINSQKREFGCLCKANIRLVQKLLEIEIKYTEKKNDHMLFTIRKAIANIKQCKTPIRSRDQAIVLPGIGDYMGNIIEGILQKEKLLNVPALADEMGPDDRNTKGTQLSDFMYVPKESGGPWCALLSIWMCVYEQKKLSIFLLSGLNHFEHLMSLSSVDTTSNKKIYITHLKVLHKKSIINLENNTFIRIHEESLKLCCLLVSKCYATQVYIHDFCIHNNISITSLTEGNVMISSSSSSFSSSSSISIPPSISSSSSLSIPPSISSISIPPSLSSSSPSPSVSIIKPQLSPLTITTVNDSTKWPLKPSIEGISWGAPETEVSKLCEYDLEGIEEEKKKKDINPFLESTIQLAKNQWTIDLVLDNREIRNRNDRGYIYTRLAGRGIPVLSRSIALGDVQFILKHKTQDEMEYIMDFIVERKTISDLVSSILDGRFLEQKSRLHKSHIRHVFYLIEGTPTSQEAIRISSIFKNILSIMVYDQFHVYTTTSIDDSILFLVNLYNCIQSLYTSTSNCYLHQYHHTYDYFQEEFSKTTFITTKELWTTQLAQIPRCGIQKAKAITELYPTCKSLLIRYSRLFDSMNPEMILEDITAKYQTSSIGPKLSSFIFHFLMDQVYLNKEKEN
ncbi:hypothetical protein WA158_006232 [Blastocystis sp. Blastoise]